MRANPFLMFQGDAAGALDLWARAFPELKVLGLERHAEGPYEGKVAMARFRLGGSEWRLFDSPPVHDFTFTPATSIFVDCDDEAQLRHAAGLLSEGGAVMMPLDNHGFSRLFTWVADRFGVSWQLNLP